MELLQIFESTPEEMHVFFERGSLRHDRHYQQFIRAVVPAFSRVTNNFLDMKIALSNLWPHYIGPLEKGEAVQGPLAWSAHLSLTAQTRMQSLQRSDYLQPNRSRES